MGYHWQNSPPYVREFIGSFLNDIQDILEGNMIGFYLHGSIVMGCFNPDRSDVDILVITKQPISADVQRRIAGCLLEHSNHPFPIEISFLNQAQINPWQYPCSFDFHFSEMWREQIQKDLSNDGWRKWKEKEHKDPDLAAHFTITVARGICLYGLPINEVFPHIPEKDYLSSIFGDFIDCYHDLQKEIPNNPVYCILNLCRVYWFILKKKISSKEEAGIWAIDFLPKEFQLIIKEALEVYRSSKKIGNFDSCVLKKFSDYIYERVIAAKNN